MDKKLYFTIAYIILCGFSMFSQTDDIDNTIKEIEDKLTAYYSLERENINLHLNKTSFLNNESVWFKGYVLNRKTKRLFFDTTNVFAILYNNEGIKIHERLLFTSNGTFTGKFELNEKLPSGNYFIHVYTNWMNNFFEDESAIQKINIINPKEGLLLENQNPDKETLELKLNPEGGSLIKGITNVVGIKLSDCSGKTISNAEVDIKNNDGDILQTVKLNLFGYGKFEINPNHTIIKASCNIDTKKIETELPTSANTGINVEINSFSSIDKTIFKVKTNPESISAFASKPIFLVVNQDDKNFTLPIKFDSQNLQQVFIISNENLFDGINTMRIIDINLNQFCERVFYIYPKKNKTINLIQNYKKNGKVKMAGYSEYANANLSISILPQETKAQQIEQNLNYTSTIKPYINDTFNEVNYYFENVSRKQIYELDLVLLNQDKPKYEWKNIISSPPKSNYSFDIGLTIKGKINQELKNKQEHKVKLYSKKDLILVLSDVNDKNEYVFENIALADSTEVELSLLKMPELNTIAANFTTQVINRKRSFTKPFVVPFGTCKKFQNTYTIDSNDLPLFTSGIINLKDVTVTSTKKALQYENKFGNSYLRGFKIEEETNTNLLLFIERNGFKVNKTLNGELTISSRQVSSFSGPQTTPEISIDERVLFSFEELDGLNMNEIDEIYINANAFVPSGRNKQGIIKIYRKKNYNTKSVTKSVPFLIKEGFESNSSFKNNDYESFASKGFENFGIVDWCQTILTDEKGDFLFEFQDANLKNYKVIIKGVTLDGELINKEYKFTID
jgi:hypothetical protein